MGDCGLRFLPLCNWQTAKRDRLAERLKPQQISKARARAAVYLGRVADKSLREDLNKAEKGDAEAQYKVGLAYYRDDFRTGENYMEAADWFQKAADQGHASAQQKLGNLYFSGLGVAKDNGFGAMYYREA